MTGGFWDRVLADRVGRVPDRPLLGRYQLAVPGVVNGLDAPAQAPLAPTASRRWSASAPGAAGEGRFGRDALPDQALGARTIAISTALATALERPSSGEGHQPRQLPETEYDRWLSVPPVATDLITELVAVTGDDPVVALEREIDASVGHLEAVCQRPATRLRREAVVTPLSRARRIAPDAVSYLAAHTEDWEKRTIRGVFPKRLRALYNEPDTDLYENQVAVQLVDHLLAFLDWRRWKLKAASSILEDYEALARQLNDRPWRTRLRLSMLLNELDCSELYATAEGLLSRTEDRRRRIARLRASRLYRDRRVLRYATIAPELRQTNLLTHHEDYRPTGALWRAWARANREAGISDIVSPRQFCDSFNQFVALLIARSLDALGYRATTSHAPAPAGPDLHYAGPADDALTMVTPPDGTFAIHRGNTPLVAFVPVAHPITADPEAAELRLFLDELSRYRQATRTPRIVVYPGSRIEREALPTPLRDRAATIGNDLPDGSGVGLLPVAPTEIDSVERVTQALQWARTIPDASAYAPRVRCPNGLADALTGCGTWFSSSADGADVVLERPPSQSEWDRFRCAVDAWCTERLTAARRRERKTAAGVFLATVEEARVVLRRLARCPVCATESNALYDFKPRQGTFRATCRECHSDWATQSCSCGTDYPVIKLRRRSPQDSLERNATGAMGNELLAAPCRLGDRTGAHICPNCGQCGAADSQSSRQCPRCVTQRPTTRGDHGQ